MTSFQLDGAVALITGAASGIGAELAVALAHHRVDLALVDVDLAGLRRTEKRTRHAGVSVSVHRADLMDRAVVLEVLRDVRAVHARLSVLVNNAGITVLGRFQDTAPEDFERVMAVNFAAPVALTRACLPMLMREPQAQILNVSSLFGLVGAPGQAAYCASKFAIRGFSEALRFDLAHTSVGVTAAHPGGVRTNIAQAAVVSGPVSAADVDVRRYAESFLRLDPARVAKILVHAIKTRRRRVVIGGDAKVVSMLQRLWPVSYQDLLTSGQNYLIARQKRRSLSA